MKPKSGFLAQSKKGFFGSTFFDCVFRLGDPVEKVVFFHWICQSKNSVEKVLHLFFEPIASLIPPPYTPTRPHTHTRYHIAVSYTAPTLPWLSLLLLLAASQHDAFLAPLASSVYHHTTAAARGIDLIVPTTATPAAVALAALG